jgi:hypothetical protein
LPINGNGFQKLRNLDPDHDSSLAGIMAQNGNRGRFRNRDCNVHGACGGSAYIGLTFHSRISQP